MVELGSKSEHYVQTNFCPLCSSTSMDMKHTMFYYTTGLPKKNVITDGFKDKDYMYWYVCEDCCKRKLHLIW